MKTDTGLSKAVITTAVEPLQAIKHRHLVFPFLFYVLLHSNICIGQAEPVNILNVNNGLSSGTVEGGLYDSRGYVWIATREGLHRYDGLNIVKYFPDASDTNAIKSFSTYRLAEDRFGHISILGNAGLEVFLPEENRFKLIYGNTGGIEETFSFFSINNELNIGIVTGLLWGEYFIYSLDSLKVLKDSTMLSRPVKSFLDNIWQYKRRNDYQPSRYSAKMEQMNIAVSNKSLGDPISIGSEGYSLWVGYQNQKGLCRFPYGDKKHEWVPLKGFDDIFNQGTRLTFHDYNDSLALAFAQGYGLVLFHKRSGDIIRTWDFRKDIATSKFTSCMFMFNDPADRVWFSMMPYGVFVLDPLSKRFQVIKNGIPGSILYNGLPRSMVCDTNGRLWTGFHDGHIQVFDPDLNREIFNHDFYRLTKSNFKMPAQSLVLFPNGNVVMNVTFEFRENQHTFEAKKIPIPHEMWGANAFNTLTVPDYMVYPFDSTGQQWALYTAEGTEIFKSVPDYPFASAIVTSGNKIFANPSTVYKVYTIRPDHTLQMEHSGNINIITSAYQIPGSDSLWLTTVSGLWIYHLSTGSMEMQDTKDWPSQYLYGLIPDQQGNLWISSNAGIVRYHPGNKKWKCFDVKDGMQSNEFNTNCFARMKDGSMAFGGPEGINVFDPAYFESKHMPFNVHLKGIKIHEVPVADFNPYLEKFSFSIEPDQKSLEIEYASTVYFDREDIHYFVQLVGAEDDWVDMGAKEFVRYINLKSGQYTFKLKAKNGDDEWSRNILECQFKVIPTFFQTAWFLALCFLTVIAAIAGLYKYRIRQIKNLQTIRNRISHDLHDDVGSTLGSISIYSEVAKTSAAENRMEVLDKIGEASREMLDKLNDIVWSINPENDTFEKLETRMRGYAAMVLHPKGIEFSIDSNAEQNNASMSMEKRRNLFLIFKEAIYNAAKYSECRKVNILLRESGGKIELEIQDDGKGFSLGQNGTYNGNGLKSMKERAEAMEGILQIMTAPGRGTSIRLTIS